MFYYNELKTNQKIQQYLVNNGKIKLLVEMLKDEFYSYDDTYIIKFLEQTLINKKIGNIINNDLLR